MVSNIKGLACYFCLIYTFLAKTKSRAPQFPFFNKHLYKAAYCIAYNLKKEQG